MFLFGKLHSNIMGCFWKGRDDHSFDISLMNFSEKKRIILTIEPAIRNSILKGNVVGKSIGIFSVSSMNIRREIILLISRSDFNVTFIRRVRSKILNEIFISNIHPWRILFFNYWKACRSILREINLVCYFSINCQWCRWKMWVLCQLSIDCEWINKKKKPNSRGIGRTIFFPRKWVACKNKKSTVLSV